MSSDLSALDQRRNELIAMDYIRSNPALARYVVMACQEVSAAGLVMFIMDEATGLTVDEDCKHLATMIVSSAGVIEELARHTMRTGRTKFSVTDVLDQYLALYNNRMQNYGPEFEAVSDTVIDALASIPLVFMHGDMKLENFVLDTANKVHKIIDWEQAEINGWPLIDLLYLISYNMYTVDNINFIQSFRLFYSNKIQDSYTNLISDYCKKIGINALQYKLLLAVYFIHHHTCRVLVENMTAEETEEYQGCLRYVNQTLRGE